MLSRATGFSRRYGENPYSGYDRVDNPPFLFRGDMDSRLLPKERIAAVSIDGVDAAYPFSLLEQERVVHDTVGGREIVVFFKPGTVSALDRRVIVDSNDVGSTGVFEPVVDGRKLTFSADGDGFVDGETGSRWNILGESVDGAAGGQQADSGGPRQPLLVRLGRLQARHGYLSGLVSSPVKEEEVIRG